MLTKNLYYYTHMYREAIEIQKQYKNFDRKEQDLKLDKICPTTLHQ